MDLRDRDCGGFCKDCRDFCRGAGKGLQRFLLKGKERIAEIFAEGQGKDCRGFC